MLYSTTFVIICHWVALYIKCGPRRLYIAERVVFNDTDLSITSGMSINGRLFVLPRDHLDALVVPKLLTTLHFLFLFSLY